MSSAISTPVIALHNPEIETDILALLTKYPETWGDFYMIGANDFSRIFRPIFEMISQQLSLVPSGSVAPVVLSERLKGIGVSLDGFSVFDYLNGLQYRFVQKADSEALAKELKRLTVRRELIEKMEETKRQLIHQPNVSFEEMTGIVERNISSVTTDYCKPEVFEVMGDGLIKVVEDRADNPIDPSAMLYQGPLESINKTIGPLVFPGSFSTIIARTAVGKSSLGFFWCVYIAERYPDVTLLWLDAAEMTVEQLQMRAVCCLSGGKIPLWAVKSGEWRKNPEWSRMIRGEIWPRVKKLKMTYKNVGGMSPKEKINFIRRFYYSRVGRGRFLLIGDDYLKGVESLSKQSAEYQALGYYVGDVKTLVTDEIQAGYWTSLQGNRSIITQGKRVNEIQDSGEAGASISDRVIQQSTNSLLMRFKVTEELAQESNLLGNMVLKKAKIREGYGREYEKLVRPVKLPNGQFMENYWHLASSNFFYEDRGLHSDALELLGKSQVNMGNFRAAPVGL